MEKIDWLFGLRLIADSPDIDEEVRELIAARQAAREAKDYAESDDIRGKLSKLMVTVKDTCDGLVWQYTK